MSSVASPSTVLIRDVMLPWLAKIGRVHARICRYTQAGRVNALSDLTEHQLRDIGAGSEIVAHVIETRTLNSSRGPGGRIWVHLMYRGPGS
jgi:hypothetical protein